MRVSQWRVRLDAPARWLTENNRRATALAQAPDVRRWRTAMADAGRRAGLPEDVTSVALHYDLYYTTRRPPVRDRGNIYPTIKALTDGLGRRHPGCGFLIDDSDKHVYDTTWSFHKATEPDAVPYVILTITRRATA